MKKIITLILASLLIIPFSNILAQTFECRVSENNLGYLVYQMRETSGTGTPTTSTIINDITFVVRYPAGTVDIALLCSTNDYNLVDGLANEQTSSDGVYDYHYWNASNTPFNPPSSWTVNVWEDIAVFKATGATGSGLFEVAPNKWHPNSQDLSLNWNQGNPPYDYTPTISGSGVTYSYPTLVYNLVWTGSDGTYPTYWDIAANWETECGAAGAIPNTGNNCIIPVVSSGNYPVNIGQVSGFGVHQPTCDYLRVNNGASMSVDKEDFASTQALYTINNDLLNYGTVTIVPNGELTVSGNTHIENAEGLVVEADATGVGSFLNKVAGTSTTYGTSGTAKVQTYLTNSATSGDWYIHTIGPTVDIGGVGGALLSDFNVAAGNTYAYYWNDAQDTTLASAWTNIWSNFYLVGTADGIAMATDNNTAYTMNMTGTLITSDFTPTYSFTNTPNNNVELISNPYPSAIEFNAFYGSFSNNSIIYDKNWVWDPAAGNYVAFAGTTGTPGEFIQVGQAFFVETTATGTVTFANINRTHSNSPFRDVVPNMLTMKVSGGGNGFKDRLTIRFADGDGVTAGYDKEVETVKWNSMYDDATMIRSIADDGTELSNEVYPLDGLQGDMVSVPVHFDCGYTAEYTFDFEGIDSFEAGNEVWLEDKKDNDKWIYLNNNPHYTFTATSYEPNDRFIIHFFGPTSINDKDEAKVGIYSWRQYAFINNVTNEKIKKVSIYNMAGSLVTSREIPDGQKLSKIWVSDQMAYYVVQVITESNVYTNKILITK